MYFTYYLFDFDEDKWSVLSWSWKQWLLFVSTHLLVFQFLIFEMKNISFLETPLPLFWNIRIMNNDKEALATGFMNMVSWAFFRCFQNFLITLSGLCRKELKKPTADYQQNKEDDCDKAIVNVELWMSTDDRTKIVLRSRLHWMPIQRFLKLKISILFRDLVSQYGAGSIFSLLRVELMMAVIISSMYFSTMYLVYEIYSSVKCILQGKMIPY